MLDIKFIRENKDIVAEGARKKHIELDVAKLLELDDKRRDLQTSIEAKRAEQNVASDMIVNVTGQERYDLIERMQSIKEVLKLEEESLQDVLQKWRALMLTVPNVPDISVPEGESDADNKEVRTWGELPSFGFDAKSHGELMLHNDMVDYERGAKVSGFRGYFLRNDGARLFWALQRFVEDRFMNRDGFVPMIVPSMV